jgi:curved DNA-binding protein CbpA
VNRDVDYYTLLGVTKNATPAEIRERFRALAREVHPDLVPRDQKAEAERRFQDLTEAVNVLTSPDKKQAYDFERNLISAGVIGGDADAVVQSYLTQGIAAYKEQKWEEAAGNFQLAVHRNPRDARGQHYLGLAAARAGDYRQAIKALEAALAVEPQNVRLLKDAAMIHRQAGLLTKAERLYQEVLRWDPNARDARKALEEIKSTKGDR